jgi:hypothetical protein
LKRGLDLAQPGIPPVIVNYISYDIGRSTDGMDLNALTTGGYQDFCCHLFSRFISH